MAVILARYAEIGLKSTPVRVKFENRLKENMLSMLAADRLEALVTKGDARFFVEASDIDAAVRSMTRVFGIASLSVAETCSSDMEDICKTAAEYSLSRMSEGQSFAVKARREGNHPYTSIDVGREAGSAIFLANEHKGIKVNLTNPEKIFYVEVRNNKAFIFESYVRCHAGLPIGTQGRVVADVHDDRGVVSAWLMMKRGCKLYYQGTVGFDILSKYDPLMKDITDNGQDPKGIMGLVLGVGADGFESVDVSKYSVPVYFPTIGMSDAEVSEVLENIKKEL